jgi:hypothetical protein
MSDKSMSRIALEQEIAKVEQELADAFALRPPSIARRFELEAVLERLHQEMAVP